MIKTQDNERRGRHGTPIASACVLLPLTVRCVSRSSREWHAKHTRSVQGTRGGHDLAHVLPGMVTRKICEWLHATYVRTGILDLQSRWGRFLRCVRPGPQSFLRYCSIRTTVLIYTQF